MELIGFLILTAGGLEYNLFEGKDTLLVAR